MTREEMILRMSSTEFMQWQAVAKFKPFGDSRSDIQMAILASTIANMSGKTVKKDTTLADFLPDWTGAKTVREHIQTPEEMHANFLRIFQFAKKKAEQEKAS